MPPVNPPRSSIDQPEELQDLLKLVKDRHGVAEATHKEYRQRWDTYYGLYRNYRRLRSAYSGGSPRDRDDVLNTAKREMGAELFIPYAFTVVETVVPRLLSNDPVMLVPPRRADAVESALRVEELLSQQQKEIDYELKLQAVARSGLKYGLGVMATSWETITRKVIQNERNPYHPLPGQDRYRPVEQEIILREGPQAEPVDIWDFFWDPKAYSIETCDWVIRRIWMTTEDVKDRVEDGTWFEVDMEAVEARGSAMERSEAWQGRKEAAGVSDYNPVKSGDLHEVWEYHDGNRVITLLDRELVVQNDTTPYYHRELPFQIFRPTPQEHEFVGIGEIEPITHLQYELNTLRSMRLDNSNLLINKAFIYSEGFVDPDDLRVGPGMGIPVSGTNIQNVLQPLDFGDMPNAGYREAQEIKEDMERASGVSDAAAGGGGGGAGTDTATGIQLVQNALNVRTRLKTKNLERETIRHAARQWLDLNRQHTTEPRQIRVPGQTQGESAFIDVTPEDMSPQNVDYPQPEGGSTEPDNPAAREQRAVSLYNLLSANPRVDPAYLAVYILREFGVSDPASFMAQPTGVPVDPKMLGEELVSMGIPEEQVLEALEAGLESAVSTNGAAPAAEPQEA